ncbi:hypothetical protein [Streptomyces sp. NPDC088910]
MVVLAAMAVVLLTCGADDNDADDDDANGDDADDDGADDDD